MNTSILPTPMPKILQERFYGMDALRCAMMLLIVLEHSAYGYVKFGLPGLPWLVQDRSYIAWADLFWWWGGFSTPAFFLISGFFAVGLYDSRGPLGFLVNRAKRILLPFTFGTVVILPVTLYVWAYGWLISGRCTVNEIRRLRFLEGEIQANLWGPAHLWFLEYLIIMLFLFWVVQRLWPKRRKGRLMTSQNPGWHHRMLLSSWKPVFYSIPTTLILWIGYCWLGGDPSLDFRNSFIPLPFKFLHHAVYFVVGACLYRIKCLERFRRFSLVYLLFSLPAFVCRAWLQIKDLTGPLNPLASLLLSAADALGMWLTIFGLIGLSQKFFNRSSSTLSYLADSSYWIYLCHLPIVGMIQVLLLGYSWASGVKFSLVTAIVLTTGYWTYKSMIRNSFIGGWLHGSRQTSAFAMIPSRQGGIEETIKSIPR
jgi:glucan biosynthesis protein C